MNFFNKKPRKKTIKDLSVEKQKEYKNLKLKCDRAYNGILASWEDTLLQGEFYKEYIELKTEQLKIFSTIEDRYGLKTIKGMYLIGRKMGKWRKPNSPACDEVLKDGKAKR